MQPLSSISIGTSGYTYSWNKGKTNKFRWYVEQGFNSVEINGSFYRFPTESWVDNWRENSGKDFGFSIKVNRSITHYAKLNKEKSINLWKRFRQPLKRLEERIDFWLFQMPSVFKYSEENISRIRNFASDAEIANRAVIEFRDPSWWNKKRLKEIERIGIVVCSVDAPGLPTKLVSMNETTYLRLHGTTEWYNYLYSEKELDKIVDKLNKSNSKRKAVYLNNDHGMLPNGKYLLRKAGVLL
jgi:uncharacterized protein YecE (DUF72 family)